LLHERQAKEVDQFDEESIQARKTRKDSVVA